MNERKLDGQLCKNQYNPRFHKVHDMLVINRIVAHSTRHVESSVLVSEHRQSETSFKGFAENSGI